MRSLEEVTVHDFVTADAARVHAMNQSLSAYHGSSATITEARIAETCLRGELMCFVARSGGDNVGFLVCFDWRNFEYDSRVCTVSTLFVEENLRGRGVGRTLMRHAAQAASARGCFRLEVGAAVSNPASNGFYAGLGFFLWSGNTNRYAIQGDGLKKFSAAS